MKEKTNSIGREIVWGRQQNTTTVQIVQGIRLWFLPGVAEVSLELIPQPGEVRFGMDIKRTDEVILLHLKTSKVNSVLSTCGFVTLYGT